MKTIMTASQPDRQILETTRASVVQLDHTLRAPLSGTLKGTVAGLLRRGERCLVLDLEELREIDAAGIGELVDAFNAVRTAGGELTISHVNAQVRQLLLVSGVLDLLTAGGGCGAASQARMKPISASWFGLMPVRSCG